MNTWKRAIRSTGIAFAVILILCSRAQAGNLFGLTDQAPRTTIEQPAGLLGQAVAWLTDLWSGLTARPTGETVVPPSTTQGTCDSGWGIDPEGCPK